ncbi:Uncharacterised protein [Yersinia intermedia]|jgi:hypothetical protein|nr:Uncharacterised protein [Yersinia intermedia]CNC36519.1 Uncharacterised protein [Yersinia intermedia]CNG61681.1 Uncharacterised protein [Yersinia intermedia]CNI48125.1 Uncharacterised protein [Yersinia intermedia]CQJ50617.1 Uncharacterised protein [Yersinia intermedia]
MVGKRIKGVNKGQVSELSDVPIKKMPISFTDWHSIFLTPFVLEVAALLATFAYSLPATPMTLGIYSNFINQRVNKTHQYKITSPSWSVRLRVISQSPSPIQRMPEHSRHRRGSC